MYLPEPCPVLTAGLNIYLQIIMFNKKKSEKISRKMWKKWMFQWNVIYIELHEHLE